MVQIHSPRPLPKACLSFVYATFSASAAKAFCGPLRKNSKPNPIRPAHSCRKRHRSWGSGTSRNEALQLRMHKLGMRAPIFNSSGFISSSAVFPHSSCCQKTGSVPCHWQCQPGSLMKGVVSPRLISQQINKFGSFRNT